MDRRTFLRLGSLAALGTAGPLAAGGGSAPPTRPSAAVPPADEVLWLNWNENPYGPSPAAREAALAAIDRAHRYPDAERDRLVEELAARQGLTPDHVVLGCGSTEILQMAVQAAAAPDALLVLADPTFEAVGRYQRPHDYRMERVPLTPGFAHDLGRMRELALRHPGPVVIYVCNPNNPTGTLTPSAELDARIDEAPHRVLFLVDEAYFEYVRAAGYSSAVKWVRGRANVVVTRTFSKIYGMAGLRLGYAFAHPETARRLDAFMARDNANGPAIAAARAALADRELVARSRAANAAARRIVTDCLDELGLAHLPSHTNFLMHRVPGELATYIRRMREHGIRVGRPFPPLTGYNRLSLGRPEQMERFAATLRSFRRHGWV